MKMTTFLKYMMIGFSFFILILPTALQAGNHDNLPGGCLACHTPHFANTSERSIPLWSHRTTTATFTLYNSPTLNAKPGQPTSVSKLCLSCHDGTVAVDAYTYTTSFGRTMITGDSLIGTDLRGTHPISFDYNTALSVSDGDLYDPNVAQSGLGGTIEEDLLHEGKMECTSCHDVHNKFKNPSLLIRSNSGSALCLVCHDK